MLGAANAPGKVDVKPGATLLQALAQAGGVSPFAAKKRIQLRRVDKAGNERSTSSTLTPSSVAKPVAVPLVSWAAT